MRKIFGGSEPFVKKVLSKNRFLSGYIFLSDLHLSVERSLVLHRFLVSMEDWISRGVEGIYILGDLFDYWVGPRQEERWGLREVFRMFRRAVNGGVPVYFLYGNRDFLVGKFLETFCGVRCCGESLWVSVGGCRLYLTHGDGFSRSLSYLRVRSFLQHPFSIWVANHLIPGWAKGWLARRLRLNTPPPPRDIRPFLSFSSVFHQMGGASVAICGHFHQARIFRMSTPTISKYLLTLGEWRPGPSYLFLSSQEFQVVEQGEVLYVGEFPLSLENGFWKGRD
ncbi:MAG: UDP-2,3-diacylglucosamine diphosphatase [Planctomycetota bacterium]|nr:MAG: UDP-2,3-diacylglucosamine diphosphatase [Planctomycetota bacterium]